MSDFILHVDADPSGQGGRVIRGSHGRKKRMEDEDPVGTAADPLSESRRELGEARATIIELRSELAAMARRAQSAEEDWRITEKELAAALTTLAARDAKES